MITQLTGSLVARGIDRIEIATRSGVGYEVSIPLSVFEKLPTVGNEITLHTHLVVKEDSWQLFGFGHMIERDIFRRVLLAKGVGPGLALGMFSTLTAERLVRAIREKDINVLVTVPRVGRKKAEQIVLDLADKFDDLAAGKSDFPSAGLGEGAEDAIRALISLGYSVAESDRAVRAALESTVNSNEPAGTTTEIIKRALSHAAQSKNR